MTMVAIVRIFCNLMITEKPSTPPITVNETATTNPKIKAKLLSMPPTRAKTVPVAKVASETNTVSQPTNIR